MLLPGRINQERLLFRVVFFCLLFQHFVLQSCLLREYYPYIFIIKTEVNLFDQTEIPLWSSCGPEVCRVKS